METIKSLPIMGYKNYLSVYDRVSMNTPRKVLGQISYSTEINYIDNIVTIIHISTRKEFK